MTVYEAYKLMYQKMYVEKAYPNYCSEKHPVYLDSVSIFRDIYMFTFKDDECKGTEYVIPNRLCINANTGEMYFEDGLAFFFDEDARNAKIIDGKEFQRQSLSR